MRDRRRMHMAVPAPADALSGLNDAFSGASLDPKWTLYETAAGQSSFSISGGELHATHDDTPAGFPCLWYDAFLGYLIYQNVTGDFDVVATLRTSNGADSGAMTATNYRVATLMAHDPDRSDERNYVSVGIGAMALATLRAEWKTTVTDESDSGVLATGDLGSIAWATGADARRHGPLLRHHLHHAVSPPPWTRSCES